MIAVEQTPTVGLIIEHNNWVLKPVKDLLVQTWIPYTIVYLPLQALNLDLDPAYLSTFPFFASSALEDVVSILRYINVFVLFYNL